jgi:hypothetical protein
MPRHEPSQRADPGDLLAGKGKVVMRRGPDGRLQIVPPAPEPKDASPGDEPQAPGDDPPTSSP